MEATLERILQKCQVSTLASQEAIENVDLDTVLDLEAHSKLHVLSGGTKVVQHSPPSKTGPGLKGDD